MLDEFLILSRLGFGATARERAEIGRHGLSGWLAGQLAAPVEDDDATRQQLALIRLHIKYDAGEGYAGLDEWRPLTLLDADIAGLWPMNDNKTPVANAERVRPRQEVAAATLCRAIHSPWQLREVMVDFWHNHFNVNAAGDRAVGLALPAYDRTLRQHCFGNFRALLEAVASSPAMLIYLNNRSSRAGSANENFARELFELHSLGRPAYLNQLYNRWRDVPGATAGKPQGYIDQDIYEAARAFTGWTIEDGSGIGGGRNLPNTGRFIYQENWHDGYQKRVLASEFEPFQPPLADGRKVLDLLAFHPATAQFVCTKLCRRLVADTPPPALVAAAAQVWQQHQRDPQQIAKVVALIAGSTELQRPRGAKIKRPLELVAGFVRAIGLPATVSGGLLGEMDNSGQRLFGWGPPDGHPDSMDYWLSSNVLRHRWSLLAGLSENWWQTGPFDPGARLPANSRAVDAARAWHQEIIGHPGDPAVIAALLAGLGLAANDTVAHGGADQPQLRRLVAMIGMTPDFNLR